MKRKESKLHHLAMMFLHGRPRDPAPQQPTTNPSHITSHDHLRLYKESEKRESFDLHTSLLLSVATFRLLYIIKSSVVIRFSENYK